MKRILITGANSYVGTSFEDYMKQYDDYHIDTLDMQSPNWKDYDFSTYDTVFHVAGIAHQKETKENAHLYYEVNRDLAIETALKAKESGVQHIIFMSSMSVYGLDCSENLINLKTELNPKTNYGKSKLDAEIEITKLSDNKLVISIIRPPMVYGEDCPGNLSRLFKAVRRLHLFPTIENERSSITVENLSAVIKDVIDSKKGGIFLPQNDKYMCTYHMVKEQMEKEKVKVIYVSLLNPLIKLLISRLGLIAKVFGDLKYEK